MSDAEVVGWDGLTRTDGLSIRRSFDGWLIFAPDERALFDACPLCAGILTERAAKLMANAIYPLP